MARRGRVTGVDTSGPEPLYEFTLEGGTKQTGLKGDQIRPTKPVKGDLPPPDPALAQLADAPDIYAYDLTAGLITVNEYRARKGLPVDPRFGSKLVVEYVRDNAETFARAAAALAGRPYDPTIPPRTVMIEDGTDPGAVAPTDPSAGIPQRGGA